MVNGAGRELGRAAIAAIHKARGMEVAGAVDVQFVGRDAGEVVLALFSVFHFVRSWASAELRLTVPLSAQIAGLDEALELPIVNDLVMVLGSLSQVTPTLPAEFRPPPYSHSYRLRLRL